MLATPDQPECAAELFCVVEDYGHILPVELSVEDVSRYDARVSDALRHAISLRPRLYEITDCGGDVEDLVARR